MEMPWFFQWLVTEKYLLREEVRKEKDGFFMSRRSLASILAVRDIDTFPDKEDRILKTENFFDDWFLFAVCTREPVYGLLKMREQEHDRERGIPADGDTPGVTISFIAFDCQTLKTCLEEPSDANRKKLGMEINRVVAYRGQAHHPELKAYFIRPQAMAPYGIGEEYIGYIASFCKAGILPVPEAYREIYGKRTKSKSYARIPDFLEQNNREAGKVVCDHEKIYVEDVNRLTEAEKLAILATHTGNVSLHSFGAEVRYHAMFLTSAAKIRLPLLGSPYASAIRADMSIGDKEFQGPTPYYHLSGRLVRTQMRYHTDGK